MFRLTARFRASSLLFLVTLVGSLGPGGGLDAQLRTQQVTGRVLEAGADVPVPGATLRVQGRTESTSTAADGRFILRNVPAGTWVLEVTAPGFGTRTYDLALEPGGFAEVEIRLEPEARAEGTLDPLRSLGQVVEGDRLVSAARTARNVGELVARAVPALRTREAPGMAGEALCLEFRSGAPRSGLSVDAGEGRGCNTPLLFLDGSQVQNPSLVFGNTAVGSVRRIQAIPPGEAGAAFGNAPLGVLVVETTLMGARSGAQGLTAPGGATVRLTPRRRTSFDWSQDPEGHSFVRTFLGAAAGNALGLAGGLAVGRQCVFIEDRTDEIEFSCGNAGVAGAGLAAVALPALGAALGAQWSGRTDRSRGRLVPAIVGGAMGVVPGYIFALSTVGGGVEAMNSVGVGFLLVGAPLLTTVADRLYRTLR